VLRLILVRHAKSAWDNPDLADFDRPLAPRGRRAAAWIGKTVHAEGWSPTQILCSPAARTRETLTLSGIEADQLDFERRVYDLRDEHYADLIRERGRALTLMLVGHNMAISATAELLTGGVGPGPMATGAIVVLDFDANDWAGVETGSGRLIASRRPPKD